MIAGTIMVLSGVGAPLGAALITYGGYASMAGTGLELVNDAYTHQWSNEKFLTKAAMEIIPMKFAGQKVFTYFGVPAANELLNVGTIGADRLFDELRDANAGPYRKN